MADKKNEDPVKKLEGGFHAFQKEWKKFLANDFCRLSTSVDVLMVQNTAMQQHVATMEKNILRAHYRWLVERRYG